MLSAQEKIEQSVNPHLEDEYVGTVEDAEDPNMQGRLRVRVPELYGDISVEGLPWAQPEHGFGGGSDYGQFMIPPKGSKVRIRLWRGHPWFPQWSSTHYFRGEPPEEAQINPPENFVLLKTPKKSLIDLNDSKEYIRIKDPNGNFIIIDTSNDELRIKVNQDLLVEIGANADETVDNNKRVQISGNWDVFCNGTINITASGPVNIDAATINLNSGLSNPQSPRTPKDVSHK